MLFTGRVLGFVLTYCGHKRMWMRVRSRGKYSTKQIPQVYTYILKGKRGEARESGHTESDGEAGSEARSEAQHSRRIA